MYLTIKLLKWVDLEEKKEEATQIGCGVAIVEAEDEHIVAKIEKIKNELDAIAVN
jgi:50S ribosomal subunit-associated GTPase HflX